MDIKSNQVYINWNKVSVADYYHFYYQKDGESNYWYNSDPNNSDIPEKIIWNSNFSKVLYGLEADTYYNVIITAVKNNVESDESEILVFKTDSLDLTPIRNLIGVSITPSEAILSWKKREIADFYYIYWKNSNTDGFVPIKNTDNESLKYQWQSTGVVIKYLPNGEVTEFKILGVSDDKETQFSETFFLRMPIAYEPNKIIDKSVLNNDVLIKSGKLLLYGSDGTYLGKLTTNKYDTESVFNEFGSYGSKYSSTSIWNEFCKYGSSFSGESAFNEFAYNSPYILLNNEKFGRLTTNEFVSGGISPIGLYEVLEELGY